MTLAQALAAHLSSLKLSDLPRSKIETLKLLLLDFLGVAAAGSATESGRIVHAFVRAEGGVPEAVLVGTGYYTSASLAAFANGVSAHSIELDDVDPRALFHYGPPVVAAALAACEAAGRTGVDLLEAIAAGCEMMLRLSDAMNPTLRNRGYHTTAVCGCFGATVASARALGLNAEQMTNAIGLAGAQASGLMEMYGPSMQKRINAGPPARSGVTASKLAKLGFTGADTILEGERGIGRAFCGDAFAPDLLVKDLGRVYPVEIEFKAYACARPIHVAIDCCLDIRSRMRDTAESIVAISVRRNPAWAHYHQNKSPATYHEAQMSLPYSAAVALVTGQARFEQYHEPFLFDPLIRQLASRVEITADPSLPGDLTILVEVRTTSGETLSAQRESPLGSLQNPLSMDQMVEKFTRLGAPVLSPRALDAIPACVERLETLPGLSQLTALLTGPETEGRHCG